MLSKTELTERISRLSPEKRALFEKRLRCEFEEKPEIISENNSYPVMDSIGEREYYPLFSAQKRLFALEKLNNMGTSYNTPMVLIIEGKLDIEKFHNALQSLVGRHESFRTSFDMVDELPVQKIHKNLKVHMNYSERHEIAIEDIISEFITPFDLKKLPLFRFELVKIGEEKYLFLLDTHHILFDGTSFTVIPEDLFLFYESRELKPLKFQFKDFSLWQERLLKSEFIKKQEEFWINKFSGEIPVLELPYDYPRPAVQDFSGDTVVFFIEKELRNDLKNLALKTDSTLYMILMAAFNILLFKYSLQEDIVTGVPVSGRVIEEMRGVTGMFVNTLPLRNWPEAGKTFGVFLQEVRKNLLELYDNQDYQIEILIDRLKIKRNTSRNPLFSVAFVFQNMEKAKISVEKLKVEKYFYNNKTSKFDIAFTAEEKEDIIEFKIEYCTGLFKSDTISRMAEHFKNILKQISYNREQKIGHINILTEEEKKQLIYDFNRTDMVYKNNRLFVELFQEQVKKTPDNIAFVYKDKKLTYKEVNEKSNQLARLLRNKGLKEEKTASILVERSLEMIIPVLSVLKAGGAYVPIDPDYSGKRIEHVITDTDILLTQKDFLEKISFSGIIIDLEDENLYRNDSSNLPVTNNRNHLAYIIYTSGSTGSPQGVMIEHKSLTNFCLWYKEDRNLTEKDNIPYLSNFAFDASIMEIFPPLIAGSTIHIIDYDTKLSIYALNDYFEKNHITGAFMTTRFGEEFITIVENKSLRWLDIGGEKLRIYRKKNYTIRNVYGPTECTVYTTNFIIDRDYDNIPIGKPVAKSKIFIVDKFNNLQPPGVPGELCVSGDCLSRGYFKKEDLTEEKFTENPFITGEKMYRTGDLARWLPDGNIEFLGRTDRQIKVRGFRIEPAEIEQVVLKHDEIKDAAVIDYEDKDGHQYLCAYIVSDNQINIKNFKEKLSGELPDYMVPSCILQIKTIPLTINGKFDRKSIPVPDFKDMTSDYVSPQDDTQRKLVEIWEEIFGTTPLGINDNFFDLGGNSIMAVKLFARIREKLKRELSPSILFSGATVKHLARILRNEEHSYRWKYLVAIQTHGKKPPLYCVTPLGDQSLFYSNLVKHLGTDQPFYSLQAKLEELKTIEELAENFVREIVTFQHEGPYFLGGFSSGGIVAFEMAQQLHKKGYKVGGLIMFDRGINIPWTPKIFIEKICYFPCWLRDFSEETFTVKIERILREMKRIKIMFFSMFGLHKKPVTIKNLIDVEQITNDYSARSYHGSIMIFTSQKKSLIYPHSHDMGWGKIVTGKVEVEIIPEANHMKLFKEPYVKILAEKVKKYLEKIHNND